MELSILKPGQTGKGILIEYDAGYISPKHEFNSKVLREQKDLSDYSKPFEFYAVLQKYNTPNRNGRIYPEKILKREAENYKKYGKEWEEIKRNENPENDFKHSFGFLHQE